MIGKPVVTLILKMALTVVLLLLSTACSIFDGRRDIQINSNANETVTIDGEHSIEAIATTEIDSNGRTCGEASGTVIIAGDSLAGSVLSTNGFSLDVVGTVTNAADVTGGFAQGSNTVASFEGKFSSTTGNGTWSDNFDCVGTWSSMKLE